MLLHVSALTAPSLGRTLISSQTICYCMVVMITQRSPAMCQLQMQVEHKSTRADRHDVYPVQALGGDTEVNLHYGRKTLHGVALYRITYGGRFILVPRTAWERNQVF
jgi:hypothetical protein